MGSGGEMNQALYARKRKRKKKNENSLQDPILKNPSQKLLVEWLQG
jgi:hypothetical protein